MSKKISKKALSLVIAMIMVLSATIVPLTGIVASAANDTMATATEVTFGTTYSGSISKEDPKDYYVFTLTNAGKVSLSVKADGISDLYIELYSETGSQMWTADRYGVNWNSTTQRISYSCSHDLTAGTYYVLLNRSDGAGTYTFSMDYTNANESFPELTGGSDNSLATANNINLATTYNGQIALNDSKDCYIFDLSTSGKLSLEFMADRIKDVYVEIYDVNGSLTWTADKYGVNWNSTTQRIAYSTKLQLVSGTYYLLISKYDGTGTYNINIDHLSANESFIENNDGALNNSLATASVVELNNSYNGQIAINDSKDYFKFHLATDKKVTLRFNSDGLKDVYIEVYDENGSLKWTADKYGVNYNSTTGKIDLTKELQFTAGTYYFLVNRYDGNGTFTFSISEDGVTPSEPVIPDTPDIPDTPVVTTYTLSYDANGGSGAPTAQTGAATYTVSTTVPVRSGYKFLGWAFDKNATSASCTGGANITISSDTVLYAVWEKEAPAVKTYTLSYNANGGSGAPAAQTGATEYTVSLTVPVRDGYKFLGWAFDKNATSASCTGGTNIAISSDTVLYAVWQKVETPPVVTTYTLSYNANGGSGAPAAQTGSTTYTVSSTVPVRSGYKFLGWSTSASATAASYTAGKSITLTKNTTLYAVWQVVATETGKYVCPYCGEKFGEEEKYEEHYEEEIILRNIAVVFKNPSTTLINYGDSIILHVDTYNLPAGSTIKWSVNNGNFAIVSYSADRKSCTITPNNTGDTTITVTVYDAEGREICSDSQMMSAKAGIWQKIVAFFKKLFGLTKTIPEAVKNVF